MKKITKFFPANITIIVALLALFVVLCIIQPEFALCMFSVQLFNLIAINEIHKKELTSLKWDSFVSNLTYFNFILWIPANMVESKIVNQIMLVVFGIICMSVFCYLEYYCFKSPKLSEQKEGK